MISFTRIGYKLNALVVLGVSLSTVCAYGSSTLLSSSPLMKDVHVSIEPVVRADPANNIVFIAEVPRVGKIYLVRPSGEFAEMKTLPDYQAAADAHLGTSVALKTLDDSKPEGQLVVFAEDLSRIRGVVNWHGLKKQEQYAPKCDASKPGFRQTASQVFSFIGTPDIFFKSIWQKGGAVKAVKAAKKKSAKGVKSKADFSEWIGVLSQKNCQVLSDTPLDPSGKGTGEMIGVLQVRSNENSESWLVFSQTDFDGGSYLKALRYSPMLPGTPPLEDRSDAFSGV